MPTSPGRVFSAPLFFLNLLLRAVRDAQFEKINPALDMTKVFVFNF